MTEEQRMRYARHIALKEVGEEGQEKLLRGKVLLIGAGGLGSSLRPSIILQGRVSFLHLFVYDSETNL